MKVKKLLPTVEAKIDDEKAERIEKILEQKKRELDACEKVYLTAKKSYEKFLETEINDFIFPHEFASGGLMSGCRCISLIDE